MKLLMILILFFEEMYSENSSFYKRVILEASEWPSFMNGTVNFKTNWLIECASMCLSQGPGGCDLFVPIESDKICHIGYFKNTKTDFLPTQSESQAVYVNNGKYLFFTSWVKLRSLEKFLLL